jgi:ferritin-like metal-binding protein YciE
VKNVLADHGAEHLEIAWSRSLIAAADEAGRTGIANICGGILNDEAAMAAWLEDQNPEVTRIVLHHAATA